MIQVITINKDNYMKKLLLTLTLISASIAAIEVPVPKSRLKEIMRENFNRGTTDQDLIEARDERGFTILEVLQEKSAQATDVHELLGLCFTLEEIKPDILQQIESTIRKEKRSHEALIASLLKKHESDEQKIKTIIGNVSFFKIMEQLIFLEKKTQKLQQENNRLMLSKLELSQKNRQLQYKIDYESDSIFHNRAFLPIMGATVVITAAVTLGINSLMKK